MRRRGFLKRLAAGAILSVACVVPSLRGDDRIFTDAPNGDFTILVPPGVPVRVGAMPLGWTFDPTKREAHLTPQQVAHHSWPKFVDLPFLGSTIVDGGDLFAPRDPPRRHLS